MMALLADFNPGTVFFANHPGADTLAGSDIGNLVSTFLPTAIAGAGVIFFFLILGAGFMMIKSAGSQGSPQDAAKAKAALTYAVTGFLLVVFAYFILQIVGAIVGVNFLNPLP